MENNNAFMNRDTRLLQQKGAVLKARPSLITQRIWAITMRDTQPDLNFSSSIDQPACFWRSKAREADQKSCACAQFFGRAPVMLASITGMMPDLITT
jgi:hypothetical protein